MDQMDSKTDQIVSTDDKADTFLVNDDVIRAILCHEKVKDKFVSIISVCGIFRQGKSFLLNFFVRYLETTCKGKKSNLDDWLSHSDEPLVGFSFRHGTKRHTTGINVWKEVFFTETPSGEEVAILLLDTQGSFDNKSTMNSCAKIFALSTLISSTQIFNMMRMINQNDFSNLQIFSGYGHFFSDKPFQKLCFLIRDWSCPEEIPYGNEMKYLNELELGEEAKKFYKTIEDSFETLDCFLLPSPGNKVITSKDFNGNLNDIDDEFKVHVQKFVKDIVSPENLILKEVGGRKLKAAEFMCYIENYSRCLNADELPKIEPLYRLTANLHHKLAKERAFAIYKKNMDANIKYSPRKVTQNEFKKIHNEYNANALKEFDEAKKLEEKESYMQYKELLLKEIKKRSEWYEELVSEIIIEFDRRERSRN